MDRELAEKLIEDYISGWINEDYELIDSTLDSNIYLSECYGPFYENKEEIEKWFCYWHVAGNKVLSWNILSIIFDEDENKACVEWDFECFFNKQVETFLGTSLIEFNENKITSIKEFESTKEKYQPQI